MLLVEPMSLSRLTLTAPVTTSIVDASVDTVDT
jgi:hypothetical protein